MDNLYNVAIHLVKIREKRIRFFSTDRQFLQMCVELISTLHCKDNNSSLALKLLPLQPSTRFLSIFFTMPEPQITHELIVKSHMVLWTKVRDS